MTHALCLWASTSRMHARAMGHTVPEVANDTHDLNEWVGVTFMHVHGKRDNLHFHRHDTETADYGYVADFNILNMSFNFFRE